MDQHLITELRKLKADGATSILAHWSGGGDSGGVEDVYAIPVAKKLTITPLVQEWMEGHMPMDGWWNNDGGYGNAAVNLVTWEVTIDHYFYVQTEEIDLEASGTTKLDIEDSDFSKELAGLTNG